MINQNGLESDGKAEIIYILGIEKDINFDIAQLYSRTYFEAILYIKKKYLYSLTDIFGIKLVRITKSIISSLWKLRVVLTRFYQFLPIPHTTNMPQTNKMLPLFH